MKYRPDIDGLRSIAVITIMCFHFGFAGFEGGFLGVDLFFVLSGYLIARNIFEKTEIDQFTFSDFYFKRLRRLFPAYAVMMVGTLTMAYLWMLPVDFRDFSKSFAASTVYLSNIQFYRESGYFDAASHLKPLLHTWSLSVEEQFYLFFPFTAFLFRKASRRKIFFLFLIISIASFAAMVMTIEVDESLVFFMFPFRIWELGLGVTLAAGCYHLPKFSKNWINELLAVLGIVLIVMPVFMFDSTMKYPWLVAVPTCLGTWLIIQLKSDRGTIVQKCLSWRPMVFIGALSYSLYLWHWPVYVMYSYTDTDGIDPIELASLICVVFLLAYLSFRYVEAPMRLGKVIFYKSKRAVFSSTALISAIFIFVGVSIYLEDGVPSRFKENIQPAIAATHLFGNMDDCVDADQSLIQHIGYCAIGDPLNADRYTLVFGDSHSPTYRFALRSLLPAANVLIAWSGGCPPLFDVEVDERVASLDDEIACQRRNKAVRELMETDQRIDSVIMVGRWSYYGRGSGIGTDSYNSIKVWRSGSDYDPTKDQYDVVIRQFEKTVMTIRSLGLKVFVVEQPPEFPNFNARKFVLDLIIGRAFDPSEMAKLAGLEVSKLEQRQGPMQAQLRAMAVNGSIEILSTHQFMCNKRRCSLVFEGMPLYYDNNHLSAEMVPKIRQIFEPYAEFQSMNRKEQP